MSETLNTEVKEETNEGQVGAQVESQNVATPEMTTKEQLLSVGEQRYEKVSQSISDARTKFSSWVKGGAAKFGRFFKGTMVRAFAAPAAISLGSKIVGEKIGEEASYVKEGVKQGAEFVGGKIVEGVESVSEDIEKTGKWIGEKATSAYEFSAENFQKAKNFTETKAEQAKVYAQDKIATVEAVGSLIKEKTAEKLDVAKEGIKNNYGKAVEYGKNAVDSATLKCQQAKEKYNNKMNAFKEAVLKRKIEIQEAKLQKTLAKLEQLKKVEQLRFSAVA